MKIAISFLSKFDLIFLDESLKKRDTNPAHAHDTRVEQTVYKFIVDIDVVTFYNEVEQFFRVKHVSLDLVIFQIKVINDEFACFSNAGV